MQAVHAVPRIKPNDNRHYNWILQSVDEYAYTEAEATDSAMADRINEKIQENHRKRAKEELQELVGDISEFYLGSSEQEIVD